ncbi:MAG: sigma 54-interacting transcriptional regulator [Candidatus Competibacter sp.]|nr:sigma 54-interacting transcriptional regulator [Candidatus Competibacter sp.]
MASLRYPASNDLRNLVRFSEQDGTIWLDENRMVLMHTAALGALRGELIGSVGLEHARRLLTRMGYAAGVRDAETAKRIRGDRESLQETFFTGPQLHMLQGVVRVTPVALEIDLETGRFYGEFLWDNSWEEDVHDRQSNRADEPVCWSQIGYASGYSSAFMGRFILFKEVECVACGHNHCRIIGKPADEWEDGERDAQYFEKDSILNHLLELRHQVDYLRAAIAQQTQSPQLVGVSRGFKQAYDLAHRAAATQVTVLLLGETGVGKERFARALHQGSARRQGPFVAVNCAALPHDLIESELFGVEKGAYTGAQASRMGKFERADGGTLFLDEVGELTPAAQAKLLRVLQDGEIERLGGEHARKVNIRLVAATNVDLHRAVKDGRFRSDLFYRLNVYPIRIPPLRERVADIQPLVETLLERFCPLYEKKLLGVSDKTLCLLKQYAWPGNVRELENVIERGVILAPPGGWIEVDHVFTPAGEAESEGCGLTAAGHLIPPAPADSTGAVFDTVLASGLSLVDLEERIMQEAVRRAGGNIARAARALGLTRPQLQYRLKRGASGLGVWEANCTATK